MRWVPGVVVVVVVLTGCTAAPPATEPTPTATEPPSLGPVGTVIATAEFDPAEGVTGRLELLVGEGGIEQLRVTGFSSTLPATAELDLSPFPLTPDRTCLDGYAIGTGMPPAGDSVRPVGDLAKFGGDDPSFIDGVVIGMFVQSDLDERGCGRTILARAPFTWHLPEGLHPVTVADSGPASGADGTPELVDGQLVSYVVAPGDVLSAIADRFGVTVDDIVFLNPFRGDGMALADERINLDRDNRNAPWG